MLNVLELLKKVLGDAGKELESVEDCVVKLLLELKVIVKDEAARLVLLEELSLDDKTRRWCH